MKSQFSKTKIFNEIDFNTNSMKQKSWIFPCFTIDFDYKGSLDNDRPEKGAEMEQPFMFGSHYF